PVTRTGNGTASPAQQAIFIRVSRQPRSPSPDGVTNPVSRTGTPSSSDGSPVCASWARPRNSPMVLQTGPADAGRGRKPAAGGAGGGAARPASRAAVNEPSAGGAITKIASTGRASSHATLGPREWS